MKWIRWWWLLLLVPMAIGFARLRFDSEILDLLPAKVRAVQGLKLYQQHFTNARELIITVQAADADAAKSAAQAISAALRARSDLISRVNWQPPWLEHPDQASELIAYLWFNQPPAVFQALAGRLAETNLANVVSATRDQLETTLSPADLARFSHDPYGFTRLPENLAGTMTGPGQGEQIFASPDGTFRLVFARAAGELRGYRDCTAWCAAVKDVVNAALPPGEGIKVGYTGRPAFVAEISASMRRDIIQSTGGTAVVIALLFWIAHRRWKPMLWLLTLLGLILAFTLAIGGLVFGSVSVISMGFAAILLGLAVDYAVVHYQEALAQPRHSIPQIRRAIAPAIFWAAFTTISAFLVLNFGGLPGLAQLGSLVAIGVALAALLMIFAYLPPLFPARMRGDFPSIEPEKQTVAPLDPWRTDLVFAVSAGMVLLCAVILFSGLPTMDASANALRPRNSQAYATLDAIQDQMSAKHAPLWLVVAGATEQEVAQRLDAVQPLLEKAVADHRLTGFLSPGAFWPRPDFQAANRLVAVTLIAERPGLHAAAAAGGFAEPALRLTDGILATWQRALARPDIFWPTNDLSTWIFEKLTVRETNECFAAAFLFPETNAPAFASFEAQLPREGVWLSSWELLGSTVLAVVQGDLWKLLLAMAGLILLSLWLAFRRPTEVLLSLGVLLLSGGCLLAVMKLSGWSWNLLNLMALPLILGTGVDYGIFMQLALRRYGGDLRMAHRSVGRALLLCGGTAIAGFGSLGFSSNAGMASLGRVCAVGIGANMAFSIFLLPVWWRKFAGFSLASGSQPDVGPPLYYRAHVWQLGLWLVRVLPQPVISSVAKLAAAIYWRLAPHRRETVLQNLLPVFEGNVFAATGAARQLISEFAFKLGDLWRYEGGMSSPDWFVDWTGWEIYQTAMARGRGVLLVTPHLGNWELGGPFMIRHGCRLLVLTQDEPDPRMTRMRQASRSRWGVETLVVGQDAFAMLEVIKQLNSGATVALLVDRPPPATAVTVELFGRNISASIAAAELARASGCAIVPTYIVREAGGYRAQILPEITYDRAAIGRREERVKLTGEILRAFAPVIRQYAAQWYHFVPIWKEPVK
ncbi:MAG TPA: MMPL family transporter [Candidatus Acidoferrum sp.]|nr:MMPL family transporter [Candidatus Acidoferrum sp.]